MTVSFPSVEAFDALTDCVSFPAKVGDVRIVCRVSWEALQDNFGGQGLEPLTAFTSSRFAVERKAAQLIERGRFEKDGSILIRSGDGG
jgi:hypothetical protein